MLATTLLPLLPQKESQPASLSLPPFDSADFPPSFPRHEWQTEIKLFLLPGVACGCGAAVRPRPGRENLLVARSLSFAVIFTAAAVASPSSSFLILSCGFCGQQREMARRRNPRNQALMERGHGRGRHRSLFCPFISSRRSIVILAKRGKRKLVRLRLRSPLSLSLSPSLVRRFE